MTEYTVVPISRTILEQAVASTQQHRLRGYDAVQLATAIVANAVFAAAGQPELIFVFADLDLVTAASLEGLLSDDPQQHP